MKDAGNRSWAFEPPLKSPINAVVSMGQRNTQLEPTLYWEQKLESLARLDQPERYPG